MRNFVFLVLILLLMWHLASVDHWGSYLRWEPSPTRGVLAPDEPVQADLAANETKPWPHDGYTITPLARYQVKARVLHRESYEFEKEGKLSPLDFALGWGEMSDPRVYGQLDIGQSGRWYSFSWTDGPPIPAEEISSHSANTHLIPATDAVRDQLFDLHSGDLVLLKGYLVQVDGPNHFVWRSSLTRTDTGNSSCELMWVESVDKTGR